ncbi:Aldo/keto reductase [Aspergillus cavernicola]|uniref:Aldo/keto reductase n=1 Tax=Aspergillus cavernicola TaxID=176166 RepID=A0ABR4IX14_9EURO
MSIFSIAPKPSCLLGYDRALSLTAGVKVSPLCLGAMNFGNAWKEFMSECDKEQYFALLDAIATKYTTGFRTSHHQTQPIQSNHVGNSSKPLHISLNPSIQKIQTDYMDLLYLHWWDFTSSVEEIMHALNTLIVSGKVLYLSVSDTPAWIVVKANDYARANRLRPLSVYQGRWNAGFRDLEKEVLHTCRDQGMAIAPWAPLGSGNDISGSSGRAAELSEHDIKVSETLEEVDHRKGATLHAIALAYVMHKTPYVYPIIGQRKIEHLKANIEALSVSLSDEDLGEIDGAADFDVGSPMNFIFSKGYSSSNTAADVLLTHVAQQIDAPPHQAPVRARRGCIECF